MADIISVNALNKYVKTLLERDEVLTDIAIRGEISNFTNHFKTGHYYFSLKDELSSVKAVMFRTYNQSLSFKPENGMSVIARGQITLYERDGSFQINIDYMVPDGIGAMQMAFEQLKAKLEDEGLFDIEHKKLLPHMPNCIGLVTSKTGAALQDILNVAQRRNPNSKFLLCPTNVQGEQAANSIENAIKTLDSAKCDVIIVTRGGGSKEDLWVFNSENIARAAFNCKTPIVSAIGHEIDFCILDFVSDLRAPTPSAAAELVVPDMQAEFESVLITANAIKSLAQSTINSAYDKVYNAKNSNALKNISLLPGKHEQNLQSYRKSSGKIVLNKMNASEKTLRYNAKLLASLNPYDVLSRGYGIIKKGENIIKSSEDVNIGDDVTVLLKKGGINCSVTSIESDDKIWQKKN